MLTKNLADADTELKTWATKSADAQLGAVIDQKEVNAQIAALNKEVQQLGESYAKLGVSIDQKEIAAQLTALNAEVQHLAEAYAKLGVSIDQSEVGIQVAALKAEIAKQEANAQLGLTIDTSEVSAQLLALKALVSATTDNVKLGVTGGVTLPSGSGGGGDKGLAAAVGAYLAATLFGAHGGGGIGGIPGLKGGTVLGTIAMEVAGLTITHAAITIGSVAAASIMGLAGGALKLLTTGAITVVGAGTNAMVGSSTIADTSAMAKLLESNPSLSFAQVLAQLKAAGSPLPNDAGTQAEYANAQAVVALNAYWDKATSTARAAASNFYSQWFKVADTFIPVINSFGHHELQDPDHRTSSPSLPGWTRWGRSRTLGAYGSSRT